MFNVFNKGKGEFLATQTGKAVALADVPDPVFSEKMLGDGVAIIPESNEVFSPVDGKIIDVTDTLHAYCIQSKDGLDILVHIGINTVELKGEGYKSCVKVGDQVKAGDKLAEADLNFIRGKGYEVFTPIIITNMDAVKSISAELGNVQAGKTCVATYVKK